MGSRRLSRVLALQILYLIDTSSLSEQEALKVVLNGNESETKVREFCLALTSGFLGNSEYIDNLIVKYAENWELKRMAAVDRNILRIASYELIFESLTPISVVIDEAVEIAEEL